MNDLKLNDPVAVLINGSIAFGVICEVHDKTGRNGSRRLVMVELSKEDPKYLTADSIPEYDHVLVERDHLIRKLDKTWQYTAPQELADSISNAYAYHWALNRSEELNAPPAAAPAAPYPVHDDPL